MESNHRRPVRHAHLQVGVAGIWILLYLHITQMLRRYNYMCFSFAREKLSGCRCVFARRHVADVGRLCSSRFTAHSSQDIGGWRSALSSLRIILPVEMIVLVPRKKVVLGVSAAWCFAEFPRRGWRGAKGLRARRSLDVELSI